MDKLIHDDKGGTTISNDRATIMHLRDIVHPAAKILVDIAKSQDSEKKPGFSASAKDPQEAAESLVSLLEEAEKVVPVELHEQTPVRVGATAGLRALGTKRSEEILQAVRDLLRDKSSFKSQPDPVALGGHKQQKLSMS